MKRHPIFSKVCRWAAVAMVTLAPATTVLARDEEPEVEPIDARLEGYKQNVSLPASSTGLTWVMLVFLGVICCGGLFKDAKRSHLD